MTFLIRSFQLATSQPDNVQLNVYKHGGHVGFISSFNDNNGKWVEKNITRFIQKNLGITH